MKTRPLVLQPLATPLTWLAPAGIVVLLAGSASFVYLAPLAMPEGYAWLSNAISESAAQGQLNAWIARFGFLLFGLAVLWLTLYRRTIWARGVYWMQLAFALFMLGTAAFSHKPWLAGAPVDSTEDLLHSITATGMGFAFALGVVVRFMQRSKSEVMPRVYDVIAILAATALTPIGGLQPSIAGLLQRMMFGVAYVWFAHEALFPKGKNGISTPQSAPADVKERRG